MVWNATCGVCHAPLPPDARVCPNCGHVLDRKPDPVPAADSTTTAGEIASPDPPPWAAFAPPSARVGSNGSGPVADVAPLDAPPPPADPAPLPVRPAGALNSSRPDAEPAPLPGAPGQSTAWWGPPPAPATAPTPDEAAWFSGQSSAPPAAPAVAPAPVEPVVLSAPATVPPAATPGVAATPGAPPTGALVLLRGEEVIMQLGALYLTNKRAILYAPTILRAAYLRDIDAIGTVTERSSGWMLLLGLLGLGLAAASAYIGASQPGLEFSIGDAYHASPLLLAIPLALIGVLTLASYFFWIKRSLFLSVGGRPLIVVSLSGWNGKKLTSVDSFVNAFSQAKERAGE